MPTSRFAPNPFPAHPVASATLGAVAVPILLGGMLAAPLAAQTVGRVELNGHVAPRCWMPAQTSYPSSAAAAANRDLAAHCNHAVKPIQIRLRRPAAYPGEAGAADGLPPQSVAEDIATNRAAIEIMVSPAL